jgi:hypothetical protein
LWIRAAAVAQNGPATGELKPEAAYFVAFLERLTNTALCFDIFQFPFRFSTGTNGENVEMRLDL